MLFSPDVRGMRSPLFVPSPLAPAAPRSLAKSAQHQWIKFLAVNGRGNQVGATVEHKQGTALVMPPGLEIKCTEERRATRSWHEAWERGTQDSSAQGERCRKGWVGRGVVWMFGMHFQRARASVRWSSGNRKANYDQVP